MQNDLGFVCERCQVRLVVYYTRRREGRVERVRKCPGCGEKLATVEQKTSHKISSSSIYGTSKFDTD
jgi:transcription initiation factor IIE alpha subunit